MNTKSPCIKICKMKDGYCVGCNRSLMEISSWSKMSDEQKDKVNKDLKSRKKY